MIVDQLQQSKSVAMPRSPMITRDINSATQRGMHGVGLYPVSKLALVEEIFGIKVGALHSHGGHDGHGGHDTSCQKRDLPDVNLVHFEKSGMTSLPDGIS